MGRGYVQSTRSDSRVISKLAPSSQIPCCQRPLIGWGHQGCRKGCTSRQ
uniref:Uncharacterized protein n=1 Tax=Anguilla anguilla TaxID=7936 RepID=A0A0E9XES6_ANGAN